MSLLDIVNGTTNAEDNKTAKKIESIEVEIHLIDEDLKNPRKFLSQKKEDELELSIKERGVKIPITIMVHPDDPTRYVVKDGNRRRRNALKAGLKSIPAVVVTEWNELDQLTANIVKQDMMVIDISRSINRLIDNKIAKQKHIGSALGYGEAKTAKYVALTKDVHESIIDNLETLHNRGLAKDFSAMYEIAILSKEHQDEVIIWLDKHTASGKPLGLSDVRKLKEKFVIDDEKTKEKDRSSEYNEKVIIDIAVKGKDSLDRISELSQGKISDPEEREEVMKQLSELIKDLKIIEKQYK